RTVVSLDGLWRAPDRAAAARLEAAIKRLSKAQKLALMARPDALDAVFGTALPPCYAPVPGVTLEQCLTGGFDDAAPPDASRPA
ncbi:MAG: hypothetical protein PHS97_03770, partial [Oscillospiraceae bacterium]|nr:hypothetical protein [Oscillospiraceae bacterium]